MRKRSTAYPPGAGPKDVATAAYLAANAGRYGEAASYLSPAAGKMLQQARRQVVSASAELRQVLDRIRVDRHPGAAKSRESVRELLRTNQALLRVLPAAGRQHRALWDMATRQRQLVDVRATREVIRGWKGRVYLRLTLVDGSTIRDSEPVVRVNHRWYLG
jgi:hypothetical protein